MQNPQPFLSHHHSEANGIRPIEPFVDGDAPLSSPTDLAESPSTSERRLLEQARRGSRSAVDRLFERYRSWLRWWARGRLPPWVRGAIDTSDLIQDALHRTFARLASFEPRHANALRAYLRRAVENRIRDQLRRATRRLDLTRRDALPRPSEDPAPQHRQLVDDETWRGYLDGLERLRERDRRLIAGRAELGYNYKQLAFIEGLPSADAGAQGAGTGGEAADRRHA